MAYLLGSNLGCRDKSAELQSAELIVWNVNISDKHFIPVIVTMKGF